MNGWSKEDLEEMFGDDIIDQLVFLSGCHQHQLCNANPSGWIISDESLRKFAKLIVRKCAEVIDAQKPVWQNTDVPAEIALDMAAKNIKAYFGVEE